MEEYNTNQPNVPQQNEDPMKGKAIAALVLGIIACVFGFFGIGAIVSLVCGIIACVLAVKVRKSAEATGVKPNAMATAGLVLGIIGIVFGAIVLICVVAVGSAVGCAACASAGMM